MTDSSLDLMPLVTSPDAVRKLADEFARIVNSAPGARKTVVRVRNRHESLDGFASKELDIWWYLDDERSRRRTWNVFGVLPNTPGLALDIAVPRFVCELNFSLDGQAPRGRGSPPSAWFEDDGKGSRFVLHRAKFTGVLKEEFLSGWRSTGGVVRRVDQVDHAVVGSLSEGTLPADLSSFVKAVASARRKSGQTV